MDGKNDISTLQLVYIKIPSNHTYMMYIIINFLEHIVRNLSLSACDSNFPSIAINLHYNKFYRNSLNTYYLSVRDRMSVGSNYIRISVS